MTSVTQDKQDCFFFIVICFVGETSAKFELTRQKFQFCYNLYINKVISFYFILFYFILFLFIWSREGIARRI
jgi:hypothetical protein